MLPRSQPSGAQNRKRKKRQEEIAQSLQGSLNIFIVRQSNVSENASDKNENACDANGSDKNEITCDANVCDENTSDKNENACDTNAFDVNENVSDENVCACDDENACDTNASSDVRLNIFDPKIWDMLNCKMKDLFVEKGHIRESNINFPRDNIGRHFSDEFYVRKLRNGDCHDRKWLVYSKELDKVFCFCCKLFKEDRSKSQLASVGLSDWKHLGQGLSAHENIIEHTTSLGIWSELRLSKNETLDKELQYLIKKDTDHWKEVLVRIIAVVKCLAKNNIAFRGKNGKLFEESNGNFLGLIEMIAKFDPLRTRFERMQEFESMFGFLFDG
ncbi:zinc finger MYM-type protein 5-like [Cynara cardunculus var. scolymus]|uniref:zinc finger MYM-type protein 5-like n=1 Tax=Cynara cardunculus var. scolymus TaxID=59895 RepID=UPI000D62490A|nr:zinc finger MYM-type protein 5-like [Cynara cardunculus var. scolymus]